MNTEKFISFTSCTYRVTEGIKGVDQAYRFFTRDCFVKLAKNFWTNFLNEILKPSASKQTTKFQKAWKKACEKSNEDIWKDGFVKPIVKGVLENPVENKDDEKKYKDVVTIVTRARNKFLGNMGELFVLKMFKNDFLGKDMHDYKAIPDIEQMRIEPEKSKIDGIAIDNGTNLKWIVQVKNYALSGDNVGSTVINELLAAWNNLFSEDFSEAVENESSQDELIKIGKWYASQAIVIISFTGFDKMVVDAFSKTGTKKKFIDITDISRWWCPYDGQPGAVGHTPLIKEILKEIEEFEEKMKK